MLFIIISMIASIVRLTICWLQQMYLSSLYVQQNSPDVAFSQSNPREGTQYACASDHRRLLPSFVYGWPAPLSAVSQPHTSFSRRALNFGSDLPWCCLTLMVPSTEYGLSEIIDFMTSPPPRQKLFSSY